MNDRDITLENAADAQETYEEFELEDDRLVVYDANNPDAWLASDARTQISR